MTLARSRSNVPVRGSPGASISSLAFSLAVCQREVIALAAFVQFFAHHVSSSMTSARIFRLLECTKSQGCVFSNIFLGRDILSSKGPNACYPGVTVSYQFYASTSRGVCFPMSSLDGIYCHPKVLMRVTVSYLFYASTWVLCASRGGSREARRAVG